MTTQEKASAILRHVERVGHPVTLQDVLAKKDSAFWGMFREESDYNYYGSHMVWAWFKCGIQKSLNEIFDGEMEWKRVPFNNDSKEYFSHEERFKDENAQALLEFLWDIFDEDILSQSK